MARKSRIESNDGLYHIINRGNYRRDLFYSAKTKRAFIRTLIEACEKSGWWLYAYVIMRNHYHLAIATPKGNLIFGMQWLQSTFANRFNRLRGENGHLFQGRYKSLVVEPGTALCEVVNYIHLNPVRAGIVSIGHVGDYAFSSLPKFLQRKREKVLHCKTGFMTWEGLRIMQRDGESIWNCCAKLIRLMMRNLRSNAGD